MTMTLSSELITSPSSSRSGLAHLPAMAEVRSPDVLHPQEGPCDCLSQPIQVLDYPSSLVLVEAMHFL